MGTPLWAGTSRTLGPWDQVRTSPQAVQHCMHTSTAAHHNNNTRTISVGLQFLSDVPVANHITGGATPSRAVSSVVPATTDDITTSVPSVSANHTLSAENPSTGQGAGGKEAGSSLSHAESPYEEDDWVNLSSSSHPLVTSNN